MSEASERVNQAMFAGGPFPSRGRLAGLDYGAVRIGVALCDPQRILCSPWDTHVRRGWPLDGEYFQELARRERIEGFVIGLPVYPSGDESPKSQEARAFGKRLHDLTGLPVAFHDERYTTAEAAQLLRDSGGGRRKKKQRLDQVAAQIILSAYLERRRNAAHEPLDD